MISQLSINVSQNGTSLTYALNGRIDTTTAPQLAANLHLDGARELVFDMAGIDNLLNVIDAYAENLQALRDAIDDFDADRIRSLIESANRIKRIIR